ncbi:uncharacterized protein LOC144146456 [Haemaphysalis longicornis]
MKLVLFITRNGDIINTAVDTSEENKVVEATQESKNGTRMFSAVAMLSALLALAVALPRYTLPPTLDAYQDAAKCVEVNKTWYLTYTSARLPELPNHVTCIRFANVGPMKNDETLSKLQYNPNGTM